MKFHVCFTIDCESCRKEVDDLELGRNAAAGFADLLEQAGWRGTFYLMPEEAGPLADLFGEVAGRGHELALHLHPDASGYPSGHMGVYSAATQREITEKALATFQEHLAALPVSCRPGFGSANDATFPALADCGFSSASASFPGRILTQVASNWAGAPLFAHYANPHNRMRSGGLDLVEIPISVDWETMIWGGLHPQDLRVEYTDARNHHFAIEKIMRRQVREDLPLKALVILTHNLFRYSDPANFRRETLLGMMESIRRCGESLGAEVVGTTLTEAADAYRKAVPFQSTGEVHADIQSSGPLGPGEEARGGHVGQLV